MTRIRQLFSLFFAGKHSADTGRRFAEWFSQPTDGRMKNELLFERWEQPLAEEDRIPRRGAWEALQRRIRVAEQPAAVVRPLRPWRRIAVVAAAGIAFAALLTGAYLHTGQLHRRIEALQEGGFVQVATRYGETRRVVLPDASEVVLNAGTVLIYPANFGASTREIFLSGEAGFRVTHDAAHPFVVRTADISTEVLGTVFDVSAYADEPCAEVTLREGRVRVRSEVSTSEGFILGVGEQLRYDRQTGKFTCSRIPAEELPAWQNGELIFRHQDIHRIIRALERRYDVRIYLTSNRHDADRLTLHLERSCTIDEAVLLIAQLIPGLNFRIENNNVYLD